MEHRPIIAAAKTGTISRTKARGAARFAKSVKENLGGDVTRVLVRSGARRDYRPSDFKNLFGPAMAEPKGWELPAGNSSKKANHQAAKKAGKKSARKSGARKSAGTKPSTGARKSHR